MARSFSVSSVLFLVFALIAIAQALTFDVPATREKCFEEEIPYDVLVKGSYGSQASAISTVHMWVLGVDKNQVFKDVDGKGTFAFTSTSAGIHTFCFDVVPSGGQRYVPPLRVNFDLSVGVDAQDYDSIAIAEELSPLELELRKLEDAAIAVNKHMNYMRQREAAMRDTNESSNSRVLYLSFLSMGILVTLGVWQIIYLKKYFRSRKLISQ